MAQVIAFNEDTSGLMGDGVAGGSVDHGFKMAMLVMFAHLGFGVVVFTAGIGLLRKARWGWITTLVSCGYAAALTCGHLAVTVLGGVLGGWIAGVMMSFVLVLFGGYAAMSFMTMLSKNVLLLYRAAYEGDRCDKSTSVEMPRGDPPHLQLRGGGQNDALPPGRA